MKKSDLIYWRNVRTSAEGGDVESTTIYAVGLIDGYYGEGKIEEGVNLLRAAHAQGSLRATYELAAISSPSARRLIGLSRGERAKLLLGAALGGYAIAALDLYYHYADVIPSQDIVKALEVAENFGSTESRDILSRYKT